MFFCFDGCGAGAQDPSVVSRGDWGVAVAAVECAKIFACCDTGERALLGYTSEEQCRQLSAGIVQQNFERVLSDQIQVYDGKAGRSCLDEAATLSCEDFFPFGRSTITGPSCAKVLTGVGKLGQACEDLDAFCQTGYCGSGYCAVRPCAGVTCSATEYCDYTTVGCVPLKPAGATCVTTVECDPALGCHGGVCGPPLPEGATCQTYGDCTAGSCQPSTGATPPGSTCVAPLADGSPCFAASECASGGCVYASSGKSKFCGPPFCNGLP